MYQWQAAFVAYCNGVPEDEICAVFSIPDATLRERMRTEQWSQLRTKMPLVTIGENASGAPMQLAPQMEAKFALIQENRTANLKVFAELREHLVEMVTALRTKALKFEKQFHNKGMVVRADVEPSAADWVNIATYARTVADGTYRALGDFQGQEKASQDAGANPQTPVAPAITIILPAAIAQPRSLRSAGEQVIDLTTVTDDKPPIKV